MALTLGVLVVLVMVVSFLYSIEPDSPSDEKDGESIRHNGRGWKD